jgi:hypothetical protein
MNDFGSCSWLCCGDGIRMKLEYRVLRHLEKRAPATSPRASNQPPPSAPWGPLNLKLLTQTENQ